MPIAIRALLILLGVWGLAHQIRLYRRLRSRPVTESDRQIRQAQTWRFIGLAIMGLGVVVLVGFIFALPEFAVYVGLGLLGVGAIVQIIAAAVQGIFEGRVR